MREASGREIIADDRQHVIGEREIVNWTRPEGVFWNVPVVYLREVSRDDYLRKFPGRADKLSGREFFWEVSVD